MDSDSTGGALAGTAVAVLAGGLGTRLRPALADRPKVLAPVAGRPFAAYLLDRLAAAGAREAVFCTGHMADLVESALGARWGPLALRYSREAAPLGTGGALRAALPLLDGPTVLALNGDSYCPADLAAFLRRHRGRGAAASILLAHVPDAGRFGRVATDGAGRVTAFEEKAPGGGPGRVNAGAYLIERGLLEALPAGRALSIEREAFPAWVGRGLHGDASGGPLLDIGTPESLAAAEAYFGSLE